MAKFFDENGNEVAGFTKEELDAAIAAAKPEKVPEPSKPFEMPKEITDTLSRLSSEVSGLKLEKYASMYAGSDPEKTKSFKDSYSKLTGYADDETGFEMRAKDAAKLAFGTDVSVDIGSHVGGGNRNVDTKTPVVNSPEDKAVQAALGITAADVEKFGKKTE